MADGDATQIRGAGIDHHIVFDDWMTGLALLQAAIGSYRKADSTQGDGLIEPDADPLAFNLE